MCFKSYQPAKHCTAVTNTVRKDFTTRQTHPFIIHPDSCEAKGVFKLLIYLECLCV